MTTLANMIPRLRRKIGDWVDPENPGTDTVRYVDAYYTDAITDGLNRFDGDTNLTYTLASLPAKYENIVLLLGQIEMLNLLILESADSEAPSNNMLQRHQTPGHEVWFQAPRGATGGDWVKLQKALEQRYQDWLTDNGFDREVDNDLPIMTSSKVHREELRRGRAWTNYETDRGIEAPDDLSATEDPEGVLLAWSVVYNTQFLYYLIERIEDDGDWGDSDQIGCIYDNQTFEMIDDDTLAAGDYLYRISVFNKNGIRKTGSAITYTVT